MNTNIVTKEYVENYLKHHDKLVVYKGNQPINVTKEWSVRITSDNCTMGFVDCADFAEFCERMCVRRNPEGLDNL